jgi:hypothetical protein
MLNVVDEPPVVFRCRLEGSDVYLKGSTASRCSTFVNGRRSISAYIRTSVVIRSETQKDFHRLVRLGLSEVDGILKSDSHFDAATESRDGINVQVDVACHHDDAGV